MSTRSACPTRTPPAAAIASALVLGLLFAPASALHAAAPSLLATGPSGFGGAGWAPTPAEEVAPAAEVVAADGVSGTPAAGVAIATPLALEARGISEGGRLGGGERSGSPFDTRRAKILLRSLTLPGWGQATLGRRTSAWVFGLAEAGIWVSFTSFKVQEQLRRESYEKTALLFAGVDLNGRDDEFRRIVGSYLSSEEYNQLVVFRDAANQFYDDPVAYRQYIAEHSIGGANAWSWSSVDDLLRYRGQRQREQRAANRANTALALAIGNRILSAIHAARFAHSTAPEARSWQIEYAPAGEQIGDFRVGVRTRF
jgi:hypothetical protein